MIEQPKKDIAPLASALNPVVEIRRTFHHVWVRTVIGSRDHFVMLGAQGHTKPFAMVKPRYMVLLRCGPITKRASFAHGHAAPTRE